MILCTIGDSFTYGYELSDPTKHCWAAILANRLGCQLINHGRPGIGNEYIVRKTFETVIHKKPDLLIVAWTSASRQEFYDTEGSYVSWPGHDRKSQQHAHRKTLDKYFTLHNNESLEYRRWLLNVVLLQEFLNCHSVNYFFINTFDNQQRNHLYASEYKKYVDQINKKKFLGWPGCGMTEWMGDCPKGPGGHPLELGHTRIADVIFTAL